MHATAKISATHPGGTPGRLLLKGHSMDKQYDRTLTKLSSSHLKVIAGRQSDSRRAEAARILKARVTAFSSMADDYGPEPDAGKVDY